MGVEEQVDDTGSVKLVLEVGLLVQVSRFDVEEQVDDEFLDDVVELIEMMN